MGGKLVGYARVSTQEQNEGRQLEGIRQAGITLDEQFVDKISGKDTRRPALEECLRYMRQGDTLFVHSIDRLARNLRDLQDLVAKLTDKGVTVRFIKENLAFGRDSTNPMQTLLLQLLGSFAEFERSLIRERQREGIALAKALGKKIGCGRMVRPDEESEIRRRVQSGETISKVAREMGFSRPTIYRCIRKESCPDCGVI